MRSIKTNTHKEVIIFFVMTYVLSWSLFIIGKRTDILPIILLGVWTPSLSAIVFTAYFRGKKGLVQFLSRFKRVHIKWYWWLALLFIPISVHFIGTSIWQFISAGELTPRILNISYWLGAIIPSFLIAGFGEELGWRGFALPRLQQKYSPIVASFILAIVHMLWHLPTYWLGQGIHNVPFLFMLAFVFPWTFIFNWLYNKSKGSLIFAVSFHAISNASLSIVRFMPLEREVPITPDLLTQWSLPKDLSGYYLTVCAVYAVVALLVVWKGKFNQVNTDTP